MLAWASVRECHPSTPSGLAAEIPRATAASPCLATLGHEECEADAAREVAREDRVAFARLGRMEFGGYVWITTRKLKPGSREEFSRSWQPSEFPEGMLRAYELYSPDGNEVVGISVWDSIASRDRYRLSEVESKRRRAMAPFVLEEVSGFYVGRELKIPRG